MQTIFAIIVPIMVLTILVMGLVVIPAAVSQKAAARSALVTSPGGRASARAIPGFEAGADTPRAHASTRPNLEAFFAAAR
jgi:hypothetical protein